MFRMGLLLLGCGKGDEKMRILFIKNNVTWQQICNQILFVVEYLNAYFCNIGILDFEKITMYLSVNCITFKLITK